MKVTRKQKNRLRRLESRLNRQARVEFYTHGSGMYVYRNRTKAVLELPKTSADGKKTVGPDEEWQGDSYYMYMVQPPANEAVLVSVVEQGPQPEQQEKKMDEKLILDQPDKVTVEGTVEIVAAAAKAKPMNETNPAPTGVPHKDTLLCDDASEGVEIILE